MCHCKGCFNQTVVTVVADKLKRQSSQEANRVHNGEHVQTIIQDKTVKGQNCTGNRSRHQTIPLQPDQIYNC